MVMLLFLFTYVKNVNNLFQIAAAVSVSTGCISYGICIAYTSPAIPSITSLNNTDLTANIGDEEVSLMSKQFF